MLKFFLIAVALSFSPEFSAQGIYGKIIDSQTKKAIPYVNVGILHKKLGTVSDTSGHFKLIGATRNLDDTLKMSCVGYNSFVLPLYSTNEDYFLENKTFELDPSSEKLSEVVIRPGKIKTKLLGNKIQNGMVVVGFSTTDLGSESGTVLKYNKKNTGHIKDLNFCMNGSLFDSILFRVNLYEFKNGLPAKSILNEPIYIKTKAKSGNISIAVIDKNIFVSGDTFLSLEWIEFASATLVPEKEKDFCKLWFNAGFLYSDSYYRETSQADWSKKDIGLGFWATVLYKK
ncbi:hypothetical protein BH10BAC1_BH10BAC1_07630 [soil metagenome]